MANTADHPVGKRRFIGDPWPELNEGLTYRDLVRSSDDGMKLIEFYAQKHKSSAPLQGWLQRIQNEQITVEGRVVTDPDTVLSSCRDGMELIYHRLPWREPDAPYLLEVLFEDDDLIALNKPSGLQVLPGGLFQQRTVLTQLQWMISNLTTPLQSQASHAAPVHRLGRGTSGILLCAKTKLAKSRLAAYFADGTSLIADKRHISTKQSSVRKITKIYRALVTGIINEDKVTIEEPIGLVQYPGVAKGLYIASTSGKPALSRVRILERDLQKNFTLVQVEIQSGRPHQIRIHLSFIGHPLVGDPLYITGGQPRCSSSRPVDESFACDGGYPRPENPVPGDCGYHLHAHQLVLAHPITNEVINITAPLPAVLHSDNHREAVSNKIPD